MKVFRAAETAVIAEGHGPALVEAAARREVQGPACAELLRWSMSPATGLNERFSVKKRCNVMGRPPACSEELRAGAVRLVVDSTSPRTIADVASELGLNRETLRSWVRRAEKGKASQTAGGLCAAEREELKASRRRVKMVRLERLAAAVGQEEPAQVDPALRSLTEWALVVAPSSSACGRLPAVHHRGRKGRSADHNRLNLIV